MINEKKTVSFDHLILSDGLLTKEYSKSFLKNLSKDIEANGINQPLIVGNKITRARKVI